jgi:hypothetical protein
MPTPAIACAAEGERDDGPADSRRHGLRVVSARCASGGRATTAAGTAAAAEDEPRRDREIEYAFDTDEPMLGRPPAGDVE